jgi:hypothetical protein
VQRRFENKVPTTVFVIGLDMRVITVFLKTNELEIDTNDNPCSLRLVSVLV